MKPITEYLNYRTYLRDWYDESRARNKAISFRWLAEKAGFSSPSFPKHVMDGKRNLGPEGALGIGRALSLKEKDLAYWMHLVRYNQETAPIEKQKHYASLSEIVGSVDVKSIADSSTRYYGKWYLPVLRELAPQVSLGSDPDTLAAWFHPPLTGEEIRTGLEELEALNLLERQPDNTYRQTSQAITSGRPKDREALLGFHEAMLEKTKQALHAMDPSQRHVSALTLGVSQDAYDSIRIEFQAFRDRVLRIVHGDTNQDLVVHLGFQLFPIAKRPLQDPQ